MINCSNSRYHQQLLASGRPLDNKSDAVEDRNNDELKHTLDKLSSNQAFVLGFLFWLEMANSGLTMSTGRLGNAIRKAWLYFWVPSGQITD